MRSMLPQSRKTTVRSAMSAGGSWKTSSSGRKRYSIGSGNSFAARNITESLPSWVSRWCMPEQRAERVAVGALVGGQQEAVAVAQLGGDALERRWSRRPAPRSLARRLLLEQLARSASPCLDRVVVVEGQGRRPLHPRLGGDPRLDHAVGGAQALQRRLALAPRRRAR